MSAFFIELFKTAVEFVILVAIAVSGVILGKKYKDKKTNQ